LKLLIPLGEVCIEVFDSSGHLIVKDKEKKTDNITIYIDQIFSFKCREVYTQVFLSLIFLGA